ncbi:hypothetical protein [Oceaniovalibus sp. ACAM 378]|uniref:hypothetical protein n=1 Tax=Oceaniovalibus sp. ACAM 378 TaxID=2599923 RepID=UPI0011DA6A41|nr:hypothetical protein [Oceaniovalibus sp. ACAM 378]TYB85531.1 hypothetical protein FQ320_18610 [Oceaniovalibus sp. ACAM 378]
MTFFINLLDVTKSSALDSCNHQRRSTTNLPHFITDEIYSQLLNELREAARAGDWRCAIAEVLGGVDVMPEVCRGDFEADA